MEQLGRYRLRECIGRGGMAEVYRADSFGASGFEKAVAIKTLLPSFRGDADHERSLIEEATLGARLRHRNVVQIHDLGTDDGILFVCMELVDGVDLRTLSRRQRPPIALALLIAEEIALALDYLHAVADERGRPLGLVHRDVSPSNILISRAGEVKLIDFGIAKATMLAGITRGNIRKGTYAYMSPEQVSGAPLSGQSDQFGLGVTLAELLTGQRPFDGDTVHDTMENIRRAEAPRLPNMSAELCALICTCVAGAPNDRFDSPAELLAAVGACRRTLPPVTPLDLGAWMRDLTALET